MTDESRVERALSDVVAVERLAPGMVRVVTWSDSYTVDARGEGCTCADKQYNLQPGEKCKHHAAALMATTDTPAPFDVVDSLSEHGGPAPILTDGGPTEQQQRPSDCECFTDGLPCYACHREGFETAVVSA